MEQQQMTQIIMQLQQDVAGLRADLKGAFKRIDEQRELTETVHKLALSMQELVSAQKHMGEEQERMRKEVDALRLKPAHRWEGLVAQLITLTVAAVVGGLITKMI